MVGFLFELYLSDKLNKGYRYFFQGDWHDLKNHNSDVIFLGNSRTWVHCNPFVVQKKFGIKAEVLAQDGQTIHLLWLKFKEYLKSNRVPKELYLQFDNHFLIDEKKLYGFQTFSTCFFGDRIDLTSLNRWEGYSTFFRFVPLLAIDPQTIARIALNDTIAKEDSYENTHGFKSSSSNWYGGNWEQKHITYFDSKKVSPYLDSFVNAAKINDIKLYALFTPQSPSAIAGIKNKSEFEDLVLKLERKYNIQIPFLLFDNLRDYDKQEYFYNHLHLNTKGVEFFMNQFVSDNRSFVTFK